MKRRKKYPVSQLNGIISWLKIKRYLNKAGLYPKRMPKSKLELLVWLHAYSLRTVSYSKKYKIPEFPVGGNAIVGELNTESFTLKNGYIGTNKLKKNKRWE